MAYGPKNQFGILKNPDHQIFEKPSSQPKTQFQNGQKPSSPIKFFKKSAKFGKTQFQISKNPVPKLQKPSFSENLESVDIEICAQKKSLIKSATTWLLSKKKKSKIFLEK